MVIGISTSGNSQNVINALRKAKQIGCYVVAFTGKTGGKINVIADKLIKVDSTETSLIQEMHITIIHILSWIVEDRMQP